MPLKTIEQRITDCINLRKKLDLLDIGKLESMQSLCPKMNEYIRNGRSDTGTIVLPELNRVLEYRFCSRVGKDSELILRCRN